MPHRRQGRRCTWGCGLEALATWAVGGWGGGRGPELPTTCAVGASLPRSEAPADARSVILVTVGKCGQPRHDDLPNQGHAVCQREGPRREHAMRLTYHVIDAFAERPFEGNPAGVCVLDEWLPDATMLAIAAENRLSETAFCVRRGPAFYDLRWFTPVAEIDLLRARHLWHGVRAVRRTRARCKRAALSRSHERLRAHLPQVRRSHTDAVPAHGGPALRRLRWYGRRDSPWSRTGTDALHRTRPDLRLRE